MLDYKHLVDIFFEGKRLFLCIYYVVKMYLLCTKDV